jgi:hypothetical protein
MKIETLIIVFIGIILMGILSCRVYRPPNYRTKLIDTNNGLVVGGFPDASIILKTTDGGDSWSEEVSPSEEPLFDVFMLSENYGFAVGLNGTILRLGESVSTDELEFQSIEVFPNPSENYIIIRDESNDEKINYSLIDSKGILIREGIIHQKEAINIQEVDSGFYILTLTKEEKMKSYKIVKK